MTTTWIGTFQKGKKAARTNSIEEMLAWKKKKQAHNLTRRGGSWGRLHRSVGGDLFEKRRGPLTGKGEGSLLAIRVSLKIGWISCTNPHLEEGILIRNAKLST